MKSFAPFPARYHSLVASMPGSVLLQTARYDAQNFRSYLFTQPSRILAASNDLFDEIESELVNGSYVAGFFSYEFGESLHGIAPKRRESAPTVPSAWFGVYRKVSVFNHCTGLFEGDPPDEVLPQNAAVNAAYKIRDLHFGISHEVYLERIEAIHEHIRCGNTYQVNFTDRLHFDFSGSPEAMFAALLENQPVQYAAFLNVDGYQILSFSPELFFQRNGDRIVTRPMKGTAARGATVAEDDAIARVLGNDIKNRSENVMIVDLLRNDLGRICEYGSIQVEKLFAVEKYETLFQMVSEISGVMRHGTPYSEIFGSIFPCGSITGAPKLRTMQIIQELEGLERGVYTGAIGFFSPLQEAIFNVPIRTVVLNGTRGEMGVGSGIVIDSNPDDEYRECLLKSEFLTRSNPLFQLIESILWNAEYKLLQLHLERLEESATYFGFIFEREAIVSALDTAAAELTPGSCYKVRLLLGRSGTLSITHTPVSARFNSARVMVSELRTSSTDRFLGHKTTRRQFYDREREKAIRDGFEEVLFFNERGELTEGTISNVFVVKDGHWFTPPVACGALPGIYRRHILETNSAAEEKTLHMEDLVSADAVLLCNAIRGCREVSVHPSGTTLEIAR